MSAEHDALRLTLGGYVLGTLPSEEMRRAVVVSLSGDKKMPVPVQDSDLKTGPFVRNAHFAQACVDAGLVFVGPPAAAIAAMGSKIVAKARMRAAGVRVLPGYDGSKQDLEHLETAALELGLPLIIKTKH